MNKKKITMVDIAKMSNVSVATVSYVLNNKQNSRIPEATRQKVLQIANLYMYRSNPYARSLATGESHNILFFYGDNPFSLYQAEVLRFLNKLSRFLRPYKYNITIAPNNMIAKYNYVDAIITYRIDKDTFKKLGEINFIPLISVDCYVDDPLFFEINNSFKVVNNNKALYLSLPYQDEKITKTLNSKGQVVFIDNYDKLFEIIKNNTRPLLCLNYQVSQYLESLKVDHTYLDIDSQSKFEAIIECLNYSINREDVDKHQYIID